jgi:hypothetical protein
MNRYIVAFEPESYRDLLEIQQVVRKLVFRHDHDCEILRNLLIIKSSSRPNDLLKLLGEALPKDRFFIIPVSEAWLGHNVMSSDDCERLS